MVLNTRVQNAATKVRRNRRGGPLIALFERSGKIIEWTSSHCRRPSFTRRRPLSRRRRPYADRYCRRCCAAAAAANYCANDLSRGDALSHLPDLPPHGNPAERINRRRTVRFRGKNRSRRHRRRAARTTTVMWW